MWLGGEEKIAASGSDPIRPKEKKKKRAMNHPELHVEPPVNTEIVLFFFFFFFFFLHIFPF